MLSAYVEILEYQNKYANGLLSVMLRIRLSKILMQRWYLTMMPMTHAPRADLWSESKQQECKAPLLRNQLQALLDP